MVYRYCDEDVTCSKFFFIICLELDYNFVNRFNKKCTLVYLGYICYIVWYIW